MTREELTQIHPLGREARLYAEHARRLEEILAGLRAAGEQSPCDQALYSACRAEMETLRGDLLESARRCARERRRMLAYLEGIPSSEIRQMMVLRYLEGRSWLQVAMRMEGDRTADGVRVMHDRFLRGRVRGQNGRFS